MARQNKNTGNKLKVALYTLGCKANQADGASLANELAASGLSVVDHKSQADICIINTCTVTGKAAYQSRQAVRRLIRRNPRAKVIVTGCDAELEKETLQGIDGVSMVIGNAEKGNIPMSLRGQAETIQITSRMSSLRRQGSPVIVARSRPFLKIQDGCENYCAYCIVPYVRGGLNSLPPDEVVSAIKGFHDSGYYEVVLTGIHIGAYDIGRSRLRAVKDRSTEAAPTAGLAGLLVRILTSTSIPRIRLSSIEPDELSNELIDIIASSGGRICPHLHIPLQSGCDDTLKRMKRKYDTGQYGRYIRKIRKAIPDCAIGADVITGFPGETDEEFTATESFISSLPLSYLHVFTYSDRKGTEAFNMPGKVAEGVKKERTRTLRRLSSEKRMEYLKMYLGRDATVVFDKGKTGGYWKGVSENYINVMVRCHSSESCHSGPLLSQRVNSSRNPTRHQKVKLVEVSGENMIGVCC